jgi:protein-arginine kinase activator protein McsA
MAYPQQPHPVLKTPRVTSCRSIPKEQVSAIQAEHQLEKLEFALAVALTRGDQHRSAQLREQIDELGGNCEEPGT